MNEIEALIQKFKQHADKFDMQESKIIEKCSYTPSYESFNLPRALALMCEEIKDLKDWYEYEHRYQD